MKMAHHDPPPPDSLGTDIPGAIEALRTADGFRFANQLRAFIAVDDTKGIVDFGYRGVALSAPPRSALASGPSPSPP